MSRFAVLFEVDNVLVRNKKLIKNVSNNSSRFIKQVSLKPMSEEIALAKRQNLEQRYGHILRGLYNIYGPQYDNRISEYFVEQVYTPDIYQELIEYLEGQEFKEHSRGFNEILTLCCDNDVPVGVFSNAPYDWCLKVVNKIETTPYINDIYSYDHHVMYPRLLKPDPEIYYNIENNMRMKNINEIGRIYLVDSSPMNLVPIQFNNLWKPVLFDPERRNRNNFCRTMIDFEEIHDFISQHCTTLKNETKKTLYLKRHDVKNVATIKMVLRNCIPYLSEFRLEQIISDSIVYGSSPLITCGDTEITRVINCLNHNGLESYVG